MKILLIQPQGVEDVRAGYISVQFPINLGYIASSLIDDGHDVRLIDLNVQEIDVERYLRDFSPDLVGITAMTSAINSAGRLAQRIKSVNRDIVTVLGGSHASALPMETMRDYPDIDVLVFGEGEETIRELCRAASDELYLGAVKGIVYRQNGEVVKTEKRPLIPNLDTISFPARHLIDISMYRTSHVSRGFSRKYMNILEVIVSRGCPNQCIFCASHINYGASIRFRSFENIAAEIDKCIKAYDINHVFIADDTFTLNSTLVYQLCDFFKGRNLTWDCSTRVNTVTEELLKRMAESGCRKVSFGVESGSPRVLKMIKKGITLEQVREAFRMARKAGVRYVEGTFILGSHIGETAEDIQMTISLIYELMPDFVSLSVVCPFPGTEIYDDMRREGLLSERLNWDDFSFFTRAEKFERLRYLTHAELNRIQSDFIRDYYLSPGYVWGQVRKLRSVNDLRYFIGLGAEYIKRFKIKGS